MQKKQTKKTITGWALQVTWSDGQEETITEIDDQTAGEVDTFLTELEQEREEHGDLAKPGTELIREESL